MKNEISPEEQVHILTNQVAALKASLQATSQSYENLDSKYEKLNSEHVNLITEHSDLVTDHSRLVKVNERTQQEYKKALIFINALEENIAVDKCFMWAKKSEKLSDKELQKLRKDLASTLINPERIADVDIGEAGKEVIGEPQASTIVVSPLKKKGKTWGRQPNVHTRGRNMSSFDTLETYEVIKDLKETCNAEYASTLSFVREDRHSQLDFVRGHYRNRVTITYIYKEKNGNLVRFNEEITPNFVKGGKLTNGAASAVAVDKVIWGLPIYRQAKRINMINSANIVDPQILNSYFLAAGEMIRPICDDIMSYIKSQKAIHGDETRLLCIHNTEKGKSALGQVWSLSYQGNNSSAVFYRFYTNKNTSSAQDLYSGCKGMAIQTDAFSVYSSVVKDINKNLAKTIEEEEGVNAASEFLQDVNLLLEKGVVLVGCTAHGRRKIHVCFEALYKKFPNSEGYITCNTVLALIGKLYEIERTLREQYCEQQWDDATFVAKRKALAEPVLDALHTYCKERVEIHISEKKLLSALNYLINQMQYIRNYLVSSELTCDNNFQERQFKNFVVSRKASLFASTEKGAQAWTQLLTVLQTAVLNKIDPTLYLKYLLDKITVIMNSGIKEKDVDWSQFRPWNLTPEILEQSWDN